ncbi:10186_t:CDS:2, partial [Dentiscutata erythropus]
SDILGSTFMIDNEVLGLIVPVTPSIGLSESSHYWIDYVKDTVTIHTEINDETLFKMRGDYEHKKIGARKIKRDPF